MELANLNLSPEINYTPESTQLAYDLLRANGIEIPQSPLQFAEAFFETANAQLASKPEFSPDFVLQSLMRGPRGITELREHLDLPRFIPIDEISAYAETVIIDNDQRLEMLFREIFETGLMQDEIRRKPSSENEVRPKNLKCTIEHQSPNRYRSAIEFTSNAIDFSPKGSKVDVKIYGDGFTVRDMGKGMSASDIFKKLFVSKISGTRGADKASIGKFGIGFFTGFALLKNEGDTITLKTSENGVGLFVKYIFKNGEICAQFGKQNEVLQGTEVNVQCKEFDPAEVDDLLYKHFFKTRNCDVVVNDKVINNFSQDKLKLKREI